MNVPIHLTPEALSKYKAPPLTSIQEIIWNSIDADANNIHIDIAYNTIGGLDNMSIKDDGHGFSISDIKMDISNLSLSRKSNKSHSPKGRPYHGKRGEGFYKIAHLGNVIWNTSNGNQELSCKVDFKNKQFITNIINDHSSSNYTEVRISGFLNTKGISNTSIEDDIILNTFVSLKKHGISIYFNSILYDYTALYEKESSYESNKVFKNISSKVHIHIIEIKKAIPNCNKIIVLAKDNTILGEYSHKIKSLDNLPLIIYLTIDSLENNDTVITELDIKDEIEAFAKQELNNFKNKNLDKIKLSFKQKLKDKKIIPISLAKEDDHLSPIEKQEKEILEEILFKLSENGKFDIDKTSKLENCKLVSNLLHKTFSDGNDVLLDVLSNILELDSKQLQEFSDLLQQVNLSSVIKLSQEITHRIKLLEYLSILFSKGSDDNKNIKERSQLQKLINENMWLLSEDFLYYSSDKSIGSWVQLVNNQLGLNIRTDLESSLVNDIPDYIIGKEQKGRENHYSHLIVEIKRPNHKAMRDEIGKETQDYIEKLIEVSNQSLSSDWEMWFLVTTIDDQIKEWKDEKKRLKIEAQHKNTPYKIYLKTWSDIIQQKKSELDYLSKTMELNIPIDDCKDYILTKYPYMKVDNTSKTS